MAQFPIKNGLIQGTLDGTPASGTVSLAALTLTLPTSSLQIGTNVQAYDADLTTWAGITPGTGVATALGVNTGAAGAFVLLNGALGTPSSGTISGSFVTGGTFGAVNGSALTALNSANITASTTNALGIGTIELGHATDTTLARVSAGVVSIEGVTISTASNALTLTNKTLTSPTLTTPILGTPASGTLTNCTGLPVSGITASTSAALGVGTIELGHASDTTIARVSAGVISVEGVTIPTAASTTTFTNKSISGSTNTITNVPISTGISGLGANVATALATPTNANLYAAFTDLGIDHGVATLSEEFILGTNADGSVGELGWRISGLAGVLSTIYVQDTTGAHPGQFQVATGALSGNSSIIYGGGSGKSMIYEDVSQFELRIIFKLTQTNACSFRCGLSNDEASATPGRGEYLRYDSATDTNFQFVVKDGGAETATNALGVGGGALPADTNWHTLRIRTITPGSFIYGMSISTSGSAFGTEVQVTNTGVGRTRFIVGVMATSENVAKSFIFDMVKMRIVCAR